MSMCMNVVDCLSFSLTTLLTANLCHVDTTKRKALNICLYIRSSSFTQQRVSLKLTILSVLVILDLRLNSKRS